MTSAGLKEGVKQSTVSSRVSTDRGGVKRLNKSENMKETQVDILDLIPFFKYSHLMT